MNIVMTTILRYITDVGKIFTAFIYYFKKALEKKGIVHGRCQSRVL